MVATRKGKKRIFRKIFQKCGWVRLVAETIEDISARKQQNEHRRKLEITVDHPFVRPL